MKTKLLLSLFLASAAAFAQSIPGFYTPSSSSVSYDVVTSSTPIDQVATGPDLTWDLSSLTVVGSSVTQTLSSNSTQFPNTTAIVRTTSTVDGVESENDIHLNIVEAGASISGATFAGAVLTYTNTGFIGQFPLSYDYNNSDIVSGTFTGLGATGTFSGTAEVAVDAYGSFTANVGGIPANTTVTRLKITQNLSFNAGPVPLGTAVQTMYSYYSSQSSTDPVFRTITTTLNLPLAGIINETTTSYEIYSATMDREHFSANKIFIAPNPVADVLHFSGDATLNSITVSDLSGKVVLSAKGSNDFNVSHLAKGIYNVVATTGSGNNSFKMIKQ